MNTWLALTKKEFRLGLPAFLLAIILFGGIMTLSYYIGYRVGYEKELLMGALAGVLVFHTFFLIFYLIYTLNAERKRLHLWLHNPMPIAGLLLSKLTTGLVFMAITFIPVAVFANSYFNNHFGFLTEESTFNILGLSSVGIFINSIWIAITFIFFWSIFLTFSQRMNDFISFIITFALFLLLGFLYDLFVHLPIMEFLTNWGAITVEDAIMGFEFEIYQGDEEFHSDLMTDTSLFYIGHLVRDSIVAIIMFLATCWIIDRKVEV